MQSTKQRLSEQLNWFWSGNGISLAVHPVLARARPGACALAPFLGSTSAPSIPHVGHLLVDSLLPDATQGGLSVIFFQLFLTFFLLLFNFFRTTLKQQNRSILDSKTTKSIIFGTESYKKVKKKSTNRFWQIRKQPPWPHLRCRRVTRTLERHPLCIPQSEPNHSGSPSSHSSQQHALRKEIHPPPMVPGRTEQFLTLWWTSNKITNPDPFLG